MGEKNGWHTRDQGYYGNSGHRRLLDFLQSGTFQSQPKNRTWAELHLSQCVHTIIITSPKHVVRGLRDIEKKKENPTAMAERQGAAIYREVTTMQLLQLLAPATTANKLVKTTHRRKIIFFFFQGQEPRTTVRFSPRVQTCSTDFPGICSVVQSFWRREGFGKSAGNWAVLSEYTCQGKVGITIASSVLSWNGGIEKLWEQGSSQTG